VRKYASSSIKSKWTKTKWLLNDPGLKSIVPETRLFDINSLEQMLNSHPVVYFKPTNGTGGNKIIRIDQPATQIYRIQYKSNKRTFSSIDSLHKHLDEFANGKSYMVQQGISLANTHGNPFDLRVMVQKVNGRGWVSSAVFSKIGKPGKVVTNYHQGGKLATLRATLQGAGYSEDRIIKTQRNLKQLGVDVGICFDQNKQGMRELGLDVAIDQEGRFWILEVNTRPQFYPLKNLDKSLHQRIIRYAKQYGRF
jgi:glutathione synthase/RimK-type ligase-like ATP-grasp enzyme